MEEIWDVAAGMQRMVGKTFDKVSVTQDREEMRFTEPDGTEWVFYHSQDCCEHVSVEDVCGNLSDLEGTVLLRAEEVTSRSPPPDVVRERKNAETKALIEHEYYSMGGESETWTFYKFATMKGFVTVRWYGESNGYYSESVGLKISEPD